MAGLIEIKTEIQEAIRVMNQGGTMLYPTDTLWGLGCDATNDNAIEKLLILKNRIPEKGLIVLVPDLNELDKYIEEVPTLAYQLIEFAENPLTMVLQNGRNVSRLALGENSSLAIRVVGSGFVYQLLKSFKKPLISTSANLSGEPSPKSFEDISETLKKKTDFICLSQKDIPLRNQASTIIRMDLNGTFEFLRP